jgi:hypothetical protein
MGLSFILLHKSWQGLSGFLTVLIITNTLNPDQQGWYYTFLSIASIAYFFEMGLSSALLTLSSHKFLNLNWLDNGGISGLESEKFISLIKVSFKVYLKIAFLFAIITFLIGMYIFSHKTHSYDDWLIPFASLVVASSLNIISIPFFSIVEGTGEIVEVYFWRFLQGFFSSLSGWLFLFLGFGLWSLVAISIFSNIVFISWLLLRRSYFFKYIRNKTLLSGFDWRNEVLPLQKRLGVSSLGIFMMSQLSVPILFFYQTPKIAGQVGLSLAIAHMVGIVSQIWIVRRVPEMSKAVALKEWDIFDILFKKSFIMAALTFLFLSILTLALYKYFSSSFYAVRLITFNSFFVLIVFSFFYFINGTLASHLRSFRQEPLSTIFFIGGAFSVFGSIFFAIFYSVRELVIWLFLIQSIFIFPISFLKWKRLNKELRQ